MRIVIRTFFRLLRIILTPIMLLMEKLTTPKVAIARSPEQQAQVNTATDKLALYQFQACPFCIKVRKEIARLGLNIEIRDTQHDPAHRQALQAGGGKVTVPCLQITDDQGQVTWMYESNDIIAWLNKQFG
jgi:glutaredoxin